MNDNGTIIDIQPIETSRTSLPKTEQDAPEGQPTNERAGNQRQRTYTVMFESSAKTGRSPGRLSGLLMMLIGFFCCLIGIPMLILPGPGLLAIGGGFALIVAGFRRLFGLSRAPQANTGPSA